MIRLMLGPCKRLRVCCHVLGSSNTTFKGNSAVGEDWNGMKVRGLKNISTMVRGSTLRDLAGIHGVGSRCSGTLCRIVSKQQHLGVVQPIRRPDCFFCLQACRFASCGVLLPSGSSPAPDQPCHLERLSLLETPCMRSG